MSFIAWIKNRFRNSLSKEDFHKISKDCFYENNKVEKVEWWLAWCNLYPNLYWARLRIFTDGKVDVLFQDEDKSYGFDNKDSASNFLCEDEFTSFRDFDEEDREFLEIPLDVFIQTPNWINKEVNFFEYIGNY